MYCVYLYGLNASPPKEKRICLTVSGRKNVYTKSPPSGDRSLLKQKIDFISLWIWEEKNCSRFTHLCWRRYHFHLCPKISLHIFLPKSLKLISNISGSDACAPRITPGKSFASCVDCNKKKRGGSRPKVLPGSCYKHKVVVRLIRSYWMAPCSSRWFASRCSRRERWAGMARNNFWVLVDRTAFDRWYVGRGPVHSWVSQMWQPFL